MRASSTALLLAGAAVAVSAACAGSGNSVSPLGVQAPTQTYTQPKKHRGHHGSQPLITHVFVIVQENRTPDNLFQDPLLISHGANIQNYGTVGTGTAHVPLQPVPMATAADYSHKLQAFLTDTGCPKTRYVPPCRMSGFTPPNGSDPGAYAYVEPSIVQPYFTMADQYAFGDNMFTSHLDASFVSHQYLVAGQANSAVNFPGGSNGCLGSGPQVETITQTRDIGPDETACFTYTTIVDELYSAKLPWRYYEAAPHVSGLAWWTPFIWIPHDQNGPGGKIIQPPINFISDIKSPSGYDADVTWIAPSCHNSDHSGKNCTDNTSPNWVAAVVNAIGQSQYWDSSVIFITWDDWGGWYDHVTPPYEDYDGLGIRVPFIIISPYTKLGLVTHRQYEQASILKYIEHNFGLQALSAADARANDPTIDVLSNLPGTPRPFVTIPGGSYYTASDPGPPDTDN